MRSLILISRTSGQGKSVTGGADSRLVAPEMNHHPTAEHEYHVADVSHPEPCWFQWKMWCSWWSNGGMKGEPHSIGEGEVQGVCRQQCPGRGDQQPQPGRHCPLMSSTPHWLCTNAQLITTRSSVFLILGDLLIFPLPWTRAETASHFFWNLRGWPGRRVRTVSRALLVLPSLLKDE